METQTMYSFGELVPREQFLTSLHQTPELYEKFSHLTPKLQEEFLSFCTGASGLMMCYDPFFKYIFDAEIHPERLSDLLSAILKRRVKVNKVLPSEGRQLMAKGSLVIMDIVVELDDGSLANVEIQRIPYAFPGPRSACYSSDLVLRQYTSVRKESKKSEDAFSYKKMRPVYSIIILEKSTSEFQLFPQEYIHHSRQTFDTGLSIELIQEYVFIPLDVFRTIVHNNGIRNELEAWLAFLAFDDPKTIWEIRNAYPKFDALYQDMFEFRKDPEEVLNMFSRELQIMDENTIQYMIDELQLQVEKEREEKERAQQEKRMAQQERKMAQVEIQRLKKELDEAKKSSNLK